jgi:hydrogenase maturation protease
MSGGDTVVIGVGHPYRSDDGAGLTVLDLLATGSVETLASSGEPTELIDAWTGRRAAILVDGLYHADAQPGRVHRLVINPRADHLPTSGPTSSHGIGLDQTLTLARLLDRLPEQLLVYAIEIDDVHFGAGLSAPVAIAAARVAELIATDVAALATVTGEPER